MKSYKPFSPTPLFVFLLFTVYLSVTFSLTYNWLSSYLLFTLVVCSLYILLLNEWYSSSHLKRTSIYSSGQDGARSNNENSSFFLNGNINIFYYCFISIFFFPREVIFGSSNIRPFLSFNIERNKYSDSLLSCSTSWHQPKRCITFQKVTKTVFICSNESHIRFNVRSSPSLK